MQSKDKSIKASIRAMLVYAELNDPYFIVEDSEVTSKLLKYATSERRVNVLSDEVYPRGSLVVVRENSHEVFDLDGIQRSSLPGVEFNEVVTYTAELVRSKIERNLVKGMKGRVIAPSALLGTEAPSAVDKCHEIVLSNDVRALLVQLVKSSPPASFLGNYPYGEFNDKFDFAIEFEEWDKVTRMYRMMRPNDNSRASSGTSKGRVAWKTLIRIPDWKPTDVNPFTPGPRVIR